MISKPTTRWARGVPAGTLFLVSMSIMALAGSNSTTLPNGADLSVSIDDPLTGAEFNVPVGQPTIDVDVTGTASVGGGAGADAMMIYTIDLSGSTNQPGGACGSILQCEQAFFQALNQAVIADGSVNEVSVVGFGTTAAVADLDPSEGFARQAAPDADEGGLAGPDVEEVIGTSQVGRLNQFSFFNVNTSTNCTAALQQVLSAADDSFASTKIAVFASDGTCITGGAGFNAAVTALANATPPVVVNSIAIGTGNNCTDDGGHGTLQAMADGTNGMCFEVEDPNNLPDIIPQLIGSTLVSLEISVDGGAATPISNDDITPDLPQPGAAVVSYTTTVAGLGPGEHEICVTANGSDTSGGTASVTQCETIQLLQLTASPANETNDLGNGDDTHTVTATILGDAAHVGGRLVNFAVSGQNAGAAGTCSPNADCTTDGSGVVEFTYTVPLAGSSLGDDTITVSTEIGGEEATIDLSKSWVDTTPPVASCEASVNPHGKTIPRASRRNEDGFYLVDGEDALWGDVQVFVLDQGSGTVFGPFAPGDTVKYTEAGGAEPNAKKMGSKKGKAGAVEAHITGNGDGAVFAVDGSGNSSDPVACLFVPRPPK